MLKKSESHLMASSHTSSSPSFISCFRRLNPSFTCYQCHPHPSLRFVIPPLRYRIRASAKFSNYSQEASNLVGKPRHWGTSTIVANYYVDDNSDDDDDDADEDCSLDLLLRFVHSMFRKISRRARKAVRSVLPLSIPTNLVGFSVNGVIILAFLWILKAFLEVVCTIGSLVFLSILLVRGVWSGVSHLQENRNYNTIGEAIAIKGGGLCAAQKGFTECIVESYCFYLVDMLDDPTIPPPMDVQDVIQDIWLIMEDFL